MAAHRGGVATRYSAVVRHFQLTEEHGQIVLLLHQNLQLGRSHVLDLERLQRSDHMLARIIFEVANSPNFFWLIISAADD